MKAPDSLLQKRLLSLLVLACAMGAAGWRIPQPERAAFTLASPAATKQAVSFSSEMLPDSADAEHISLAQLGDGRIAAAWSRREASAGIRFSLLDKSGWQAPTPIATQETTAGAALARIGRLSAPVLYGEGGWLHLWYAGQAYAGEGGGSIYHTRSTDAGRSWSPAEKLAAAPQVGSGLSPHGTPLPLADGGIALTATQDTPDQGSIYLRLAPTGRILEKARLAGASPSLVATDVHTTLALSADRRDGAPSQFAQISDNAGLSWQTAPHALPPLNAQSPGALLRLPDGRLLLAANAPQTRGELQLWRADAAGQSWQRLRSIESAADGAADFSNPVLLLARDGRIHLAYRWRQQAIRHLSFNEAWLDGATP